MGGSLLRISRVSDDGTYQLLLDSQTLRSLLLELPNRGSDPSPVPRGFTRVVNKEMDKLESIIKVLKTPPEAVVAMYTATVPTGNAAHLRQLFGVKGLKKSEINAYMALYTGPAGDDESSSHVSESEDGGSEVEGGAGESTSRTARIGRKLLGR